MPLVALSQAGDYRFPAGMFDVRGWTVRTLVDDRAVGEVHDLLLDEAGTPRYLDVDLGRFRKHVLIPIGQARVDRRAHVIWVPGFNRRQFSQIPEYRHELTRFDRAAEARLVAAYKSAFAGEHRSPEPRAAGATDGAFYDEPRFNARAFYGPESV